MKNLVDQGVRVDDHHQVARRRNLWVGQSDVVVGQSDRLRIRRWLGIEEHRLGE